MSTAARIEATKPVASRIITITPYIRLQFDDYFVRALLTILQPIASNPSSATVAEGPAGAESAKFPGLARPDDPDHARNLRLELERMLMRPLLLR